MSSDFVSRIAENVRARGYDDTGMTQNQYVLSQLCKCVIELHELLQCFGLDAPAYPFAADVEGAAASATFLFNRPDRMGLTRMNNALASAELVDVIIPLVVAANTLGVDVVEGAIRKSAGDVKRGLQVNGDRK